MTTRELPRPDQQIQIKFTDHLSDKEVWVSATAVNVSSWLLHCRIDPDIWLSISGDSSNWRLPADG